MLVIRILGSVSKAQDKGIPENMAFEDPCVDVVPVLDSFAEPYLELPELPF